MAGLSLGEYTALYAADRVDFDDAINLVARRGAAMQRAALATASGMVCVLGVDEAQASALCQAAAQGQVLTPANFNCPGQVVISGESAACKRAMEMAEQHGATGTVALNVAGAFHCDLMAPAAEELRGALEAVDFRMPSGPAQSSVVANVDARPYVSAGEVRPKLLAQLTAPVRWQQSIEFLISQGVETFYEIGPNRVLAGLLRRIDRKKKVVCLNSAEAIEKLFFEKVPEVSTS